MLNMVNEDSTASDSEYTDLNGLMKELEDVDFEDELPDNELTDFITRGPILIDDDAAVGTGSIETTITNLTYDDDFLRIYIFSTIAVMICMIAMILACLLALKRRRSSLQKVISINQVFRSSDAGLESAGTPDLGLASANIAPSDIGKTSTRVLPAITGLPLPPTPGSSNESTTSSEDSQKRLMKLSQNSRPTHLGISHSMREPVSAKVSSSTAQTKITTVSSKASRRSQSTRIGFEAKPKVVRQMSDYHQHSD